MSCNLDMKCMVCKYLEWPKQFPQTQPNSLDSTVTDLCYT